MNNNYQTPEMRFLSMHLENNFLTSGYGEDADPKEGSWLFDDEI